MKIIVLFFSILILISHNLLSQDLYLAKSFGGNLGDEGRSIAVDFQGNIYTTGIFNGTVDFDPGPNTFNLTSSGAEDIFLSKLDANGNFVWAKSIGGAGMDLGKDIALDLSGNIYLVGSFESNVDFDLGLGVFSLTSAGDADMFISKIDINGNLIWVKTIGGLNKDIPSSIVLDPLGNIHIAGFFMGTVDFDPGAAIFNLFSNGAYEIFISKLDSSGNFVWAKSIGGSDTDGAMSIELDASGNVYTTGYFKGIVDFDPGVGTYNLTSVGLPDVFISKLDATGNFVWAKCIADFNNNSNGFSGNYSYSIKVDAFENVYTAGIFEGYVDFDPGIDSFNIASSSGSFDMFISKLDVNGNFVWAKTIGSASSDYCYSIVLDSVGNIYATGFFQETVDFDPSAGIHNLTSFSGGLSDVFISKFNTNGDLIWAERMGGASNDIGRSIALDQAINIYTTGYFEDISDFDPDIVTTFNLTAVGYGDVFVSKYMQSSVAGKIYNDINQNCNRDNYEPGLSGKLALVNPGNILVTTNNIGVWKIDSLPPGSYSITYDVPQSWQTTCPITQYFTVTNTNITTNTPDFGLVSTNPCGGPNVSITTPFLRRCFSNQVVYVQACNSYSATGALNAAYVDVELDHLLAPTSSSLSYTSLGNNKYRFNVGNINPGQCVNFTINTTVSCAANLQQTLCMEARLFPVDSCVFDTIATPTLPVGPGTVSSCNLPWDHSSLSVDGYCANDTVYFTVTNNGSSINGNMLCYAPVRVYVDGVLSYTDSIMLTGGQTITYSYPGNGQTWLLQADQHPLHPGNSHPNAHVEACGNIANWTPGLVNNLPLDDADPIVDMYCGVVSGAYDPNDKTGFPTGLGTEHEILPNQQLQYLIRFQNTGTDTAFNIVVRDTLDTELNIFSVVPGVSSHNYSFRMFGPRVLEWTFNNIMLPDSNVNEATSHGFLTFTVDQQPNLNNGTTILNDADIYFDFNVPVITNETVHTINNQLHNFAVGIAPLKGTQNSTIKVFPNPTKGSVYVELKEVSPKTEIMVLNVLGQQISKQQFYNVNACNLTIEGEPGVYFIKVVSGGKTEYIKLLKL